MRTLLFTNVETQAIAHIHEKLTALAPLRTAKQSAGKSLSAGTLIIPAHVLASIAAQANTPKPMREPTTTATSAFCKAAARAADAMLLAFMPPPFGDTSISERRLARAHALRADALNASDAPSALDTMRGEALRQYFATLRTA